VRAVQHEQVGAVGLGAEDGEAVAVGHVFPAREHDVAVGPDDGIALVALVEADLLDAAAVGGHRVQVEHTFALVLVGGEVAAAQCLAQVGLGLAVAAEDDAAVGGQVDRIDVVVFGAGRQALEAALGQCGSGTPAHHVFPQVPAPGAGLSPPAVPSMVAVLRPGSAVQRRCAGRRS
jgi:hypothetical protein